jgi:hypothetical protein
MKVCSYCKVEKDLSLFYKDKSAKSGLRSNCKECCSKYQKNNLEKSREYSKKYKFKNKSKFRSREYMDTINARNREKYKNGLRYKRNKRNKTEFEKFLNSIRNSILNSFKRNGYKKMSKTCEILGCTFEEFKLHIESKFEPWMSWENRGLFNGELNFGWDIDHIIPISTAKKDEDLIRLNHYTNLQPLCSYVNRVIKRNRLSALTE